MADLKVEDLAGMEYAQEKCLSCHCFTQDACDDCTHPDKPNAPLGAGCPVPPFACLGGHRCDLARLEGRAFLAESKLDSARNSLAAHRETLEEVIKQACGCWCAADCGNPNDERMPAYCAWGRKARLAMSPDPGQAILARLKAGEAALSAWQALLDHQSACQECEDEGGCCEAASELLTTAWTAHRAAKAAYDKAAGSQPEPGPITDQATAAETQTVPERELREAIRGLRGEIGGTRIYLSPAVLLLPEPKLDEFLAGILENVMRIAREMREKRAREEGTPADD